MPLFGNECSCKYKGELDLHENEPVGETHPRQVDIGTNSKGNSNLAYCSYKFGWPNNLTKIKRMGFKMPDKRFQVCF